MPTIDSKMAPTTITGRPKVEPPMEERSIWPICRRLGDQLLLGVYSNAVFGVLRDRMDPGGQRKFGNLCTVGGRCTTRCTRPPRGGLRDSPLPLLRGEEGGVKKKKVNSLPLAFHWLTLAALQCQEGGQARSAHDTADSRSDFAIFLPLGPKVWRVIWLRARCGVFRAGAAPRTGTLFQAVDNTPQNYRLSMLWCIRSCP